MWWSEHDARPFCTTSGPRARNHLMCAASRPRRCHPFVAASAQVVPADAAAVFVGEQHLLPKRGIAAALRLLGCGRVVRIEAQPDGIRHVLANALGKMRIQNAAGDLRDERRIVREREAHRLGESAFDVTAPQLGDRRRGAGRARGDLGRPDKLPDAVGPKMPKGIVPGLLRAGGAELLQQLPELVLDAGEFHQRRFAAQHAPEREQHQQRLMHRTPVPLLPDANAVERNQDFVVGHGQYYFALCGSIQRTPPPGSSLSAA